MCTRRNVLEDALQQDLIVPFVVDEHGLLQQVANELHELVDSMVDDEVPLVMQVGEHGGQESEAVLFGELVEHVGNIGGQVVLVDHLVEVPDPVEQGFDH